MWLVSGRTIDYSTICAFRREHEKGLKELFKQMIGIAVDLNMANLAIFASRRHTNLGQCQSFSNLDG